MEKDEKREKVLLASLKMFARYGFKKTTVEDIAGELGMTKGNLYLYAKDKKDLYNRSVAWALLRWQGKVAEAVREESGAQAQFQVLCHKAVEYLTEDDHLREILIHDPDIFPMFSDHDPYADINNASVAMIQQILRLGIEEGVFRHVEVERIAEVIFSIYKMFIIRTYIRQEGEKVHQMFEDTLELVMKGLLF